MIFNIIYIIEILVFLISLLCERSTIPAIIRSEEDE